MHGPSHELIMEKYNEFRTQIQGTMLLVPKQGRSSPSPIPVDGVSEDPCIEQVNSAAAWMAELDNYMDTWAVEMLARIQAVEACRALHPEYVPPIQIDP